MFFLFYGTDGIKARAAAKKNIEAALKKHAGAEFFRLTNDKFSLDKLDELIAGQGLFYSGSVVLADHLFESDQAEEILKRAKALRESANFFVFLETKLNKKELEKITKQAHKVECFDKPKRTLTKKEKLAEKGEKIDFFEFADTLGSRDKKVLWTLFQDALNEGVPQEEVHGIFFWQVKAMLAAIKSTSPAEAGLNPFVYDKAKRFAKKYEIEKLESMSRELFQMYHRAHRGEIDFAVSLERFILEIWYNAGYEYNQKKFGLHYFFY